MKANEFAKKEHFSFEELRELVSLLRSPSGCPWDREQTHESIRNCFVEEAYEVCEGIDRRDDPLLCEELGDVLFQVLFHTDIASSEKRFGMEQVIDGICRKMIRRHPHIFLGESLAEDRIQDSWDEIKRKEKGERSLADTLSRVSTALPSLKRAEKFIEKGASEQAVPEEDEVLKTGEELFFTVKRSMEKGIDAEEALNRYLKHLLEMHKM